MERMARRFCRFRPTLYGPSEPNHSCHGPNVPIFHIHCGGGKPRHDHRRKFGERNGNRGDGRGLNDQQHRPAVEEAPERPERFAQINVLPAGVRHGRGQFAIAQRADQGHHAGSSQTTSSSPGLCT